MASLEGAELLPELHITGSAEDASLFARRICTEEHEPFIVAGGGDGTINGVVNGLVPGRATLGVLPLGTANVLAKELRIRSLHEAVEKIVGQRSRPVSVGKLESAGKTTYFLLMAGVGFDGAVVEGVRLAEKRLVGKGAYFFSALRVLAGWDRQMFSICIDGNEMLCHGAVICNASRYGGNFILAPEAEIFTSDLQVVCVKNSRLTTYLRLIAGLAAGRVSGEGLAVVRGREIEISGEKAVQLDGDFHCRGPVRITSVENFLNIIV